MPSIIGSSSIYGNLITGTGPTGHTGPIGYTGPRGPTGTTGGPTGGTGVYIFDVTSNPSSNTIAFTLSDGSVIGPIFGFTGPDINYSDSRGISGYIAAGYYSGLSGVVSGYTFVFRGITGDGQYVIASMSPDKSEILLQVKDINLGGGIVYGVTSDGFLVYTGTTFTAANTKIEVSGQILQDNASGFFNTSSSTYLSFGLTASSSSIILANDSVKVYSEFETPYISVPSVGRGVVTSPVNDAVVGVDSGGYILNLNKASVFKLATPIGITAFTESEFNPTDTMKTWTFFIEGPDVWNLPSNLYFDGGLTGIGVYAFSSGMNILQITKNSNSNNYIASFVDRFIGSNTDTQQYGGVGSCCYDGGCVDYVTESVCSTYPNGVFNALKSCDTGCLIGSCCIDNKCYDNVSKQTCLEATGNATAWRATRCIGSSCNPGAFVYDLEEQPEKNTTITNAAVVTDTTTWQKVVSYKVITDDPTARVIVSTFPRGSVTFQAYGAFTLSPTDSNVSDIPAVNNEIISVYFTNSANSIEEVFKDSYATETIQLEIRINANIGTSTETTKITKTNTLKPALVPYCNGVAGTVQIKTSYEAIRYCRDCYVITPASNRYYFGIQKQAGTFDFCLNPTTLTITPRCAKVGNVIDTNPCKITEANNRAWVDLDDPDLKPLAVNCNHKEYGFLTTNCDNGCDAAVAIGSLGETVCKGQTYGSSLPYWHYIDFKDTANLKTQLVLAGVTGSRIDTILNECNTIITGLTNNNQGTINPLLFYKDNQNVGITFNDTGSSCCTPTQLNDGTDICSYNFSPTFDYNAPPGKKITYNLFAFSVVEQFFVSTTCCLPGSGGRDGAYASGGAAEHAQGYYILHRAETDTNTGKLSDPTNPGCFYLLPVWDQWSCTNGGCGGCDAAGGGGSSTYIGPRFSGPSFVGEIRPGDLGICSGVSRLKTIPCGNFHSGRLPVGDQRKYCNFPEWNFGGCANNGWSNAAVAEGIVATKPTISTEDRLNRESWVWDYYIGPKTCSNGCDLTDSGRSCNDTAGCKFSDQWCSSAFNLRGKNQGIFTDGGFICSDREWRPQLKRRKIVLEETKVDGITAIAPYVYKIVSATDPSWTEARNPNEIVWCLRGDAASSTEWFDEKIPYPPTQNSFNGKLTDFDTRHEVIAYYTDGLTLSNFETSPPVYTEIFKKSLEKYDIPTIDFGVKEFEIFNNKLYINASAVCDATKPTSCFIAQNGSSKQIINSNGWELGPWRFDLWYPNTSGLNAFKYESFDTDVDNGNMWNDKNNNPIEGFSYDSNNILSNYQTSVTNQDGSTDIQIRFWITLTAMFKKQIDGVDVYTYTSRVKQFGVIPGSINSSAAFTSTFKNKLLTDEITGTSQCVSINCDTAPYICEAYPDC